MGWPLARIADGMRHAAARVLGLARASTPASPLAAILAAILGGATACGSSERAPPAASAGSFSTGAGGAGRGGAGGQAGGSSGTPSAPIDSTGGSGPTSRDAGEPADAIDAGDVEAARDAGAADDDEVDGSPGNEEPGNEEPGTGEPPIDDPSDAGGEDLPATWSCDGDFAYGAGDTLAYTDPTPSALASALTEIAGPGHPISLVLHEDDGAQLGALSATTADAGGLASFASSDVPLAPVVAAFGSPPGVTTDDPQPFALLRFEDQAGPVEIELEHVVWRATQSSRSCDTLSVSLQAVIPSSQLSVVLHLAAGDSTIGELSSGSSGPIVGPPPPPTPVEIAATFEGVLLNFDFDSL